jgi:hypothetical protein
MREAGAENSVVFPFGYPPDRTTERALARSAVVPAQAAFIIMFALFERDGTIEGKKILYIGVVMVAEALVGFDTDNTSGAKVGLPAASATQSARPPSRFIIDDPVATSLLDCPQVSLRKMIPLFG